MTTTTTTTTATNYKIGRLARSDLPTLATHIQASKLPLPVNRFLFKDWPAFQVQYNHYTHSIEANFENPNVERFKVVDTGRARGGEDGEVVGHLILTRKRGSGGKKSGKEAAEARTEGQENGKQGGGIDDGNVVKVPEYFNAEVFTAVMDLISTIVVPEHLEHLELTHLYILPAYRRRGLGSQLVSLSIEKAEEAGVPLYLGSEPESHDFFRNLGFEDGGFADIDLRRWAPVNSGFGVFRLTNMVFRRRHDEGGIGML